jgi:hypothetical protein
LPGYLAVKSLWRAACTKDFLLANETDLFLMYLRSFIYDDWSFVAELLSPQSDEIRGAEAVVNHLNKRLRQWDNLSPENLREYDTSLAAGPSSAVPRDADILVESAAAELGRNRLDMLTKDLVAESTREKSASAIVGWWNAAVLGRRRFMNLLSVPAELREVSGALPEVYWQGISVLTPQAADFVAEQAHWCGNAELEVIFSLRGDLFERAAVTHRGNQVISCTSLGLEEDAAGTRQRVREVFLGRSKVTEAEKVVRLLVDRIVAQTWFKVAMDHCKAQVERIIDDFYKDISLRFARDYAAADQCATAMAQNGLLPILEMSATVKGLALLGLATSLNPAEDFVELVFQDNALSLSKTMQALEAAYRKYGYPPRVLRAENTLLTTV